MICDRDLLLKMFVGHLRMNLGYRDVKKILTEDENKAALQLVGERLTGRTWPAERQLGLSLFKL